MAAVPRSGPSFFPHPVLPGRRQGNSDSAYIRRALMPVKLTSKNRLTLPGAATDCFDVTTENGRIVLTPVRVNRADGVRAKLAEPGLSETDVKEAVAWARSGA